MRRSTIRRNYVLVCEPLECRRTPVWEVEDYVQDTESSFVNKVYTSVDKVSYQDSQTRKKVSFNEAAMPCAL